MRTYLSVLLVLALGACSGKTSKQPADISSTAEVTTVDLVDSRGDSAIPQDLAEPDEMSVPDLPDVAEEEVTDVSAIDLVEDVDLVETVEPTCLNVPVAGEYSGEGMGPAAGGPGVNGLEQPLFETMADALLAKPNIFFVDTWHSDSGLYEVRWNGGSMQFQRTFGEDGPLFDVVELDGELPFGCTDPAGFNTYEAALAAGTNPMATNYEDLGYAPDDPRVVFIPTEDHCYPFPYLRIAQLYDSPNAPDFHYSPMPWGVGSGGSHGALDVIQSRTPLVIAGHGLRQGFETEKTPLGVDIAPTILHLLGAEAEAGLRHGREYSETYLKWQDGAPLTGLWDEGQCVEPFQFAFIFLYDGLNANELTWLYESQEVALPAFFDIMDEALIFRNGAVVGFPSVSVPGHLSVGTGLLNGHHHFLGNGFYYRAEDQTLAPGDIMAQADRYLADPKLALDLFDFIMNPLGETIFEAARRHFGEGVYTASVNELTLRGADHSIIDMASAFADSGRADYYDLADQVAIPQVLGLLDEHAGTQKKMLFFVSFYGTDDAGEAGGPHGQALRDKLKTIDLYMGKFLERLDKLGIRDRSVIVLTADHGMELQDKNRSGGWQGAMQATGVKYKDPDGFGFVYLPVLKVACQDLNCVDGSCAATVSVTDADTGLPVADASVQLNVPASTVATTDAAGTTQFAGPDGTFELLVQHEKYNPAVHNCQ